MPESRTPADYAEALRASFARHRSGLISRDEHLAHARQIWIEVLARDLVSEVQAELRRTGVG